MADRQVGRLSPGKNSAEKMPAFVKIDWQAEAVCRHFSTVICSAGCAELQAANCHPG
jgi:hypothetical protein